MLDTTSSVKLQTLISLGGLDSLSVPKRRLFMAGHTPQKVLKIMAKRPIFAGQEESPVKCSKSTYALP